MTTQESSTGISRRTVLAAAAVGGAAFAVPSLWAQSRLEKTSVSVAVGGQGSLYSLPLTIAAQLGYFKAEGLDVEINDFAGGSKALQAVVGGSADVCSGAFEHTISLQPKGQYFKSFVLQGRAPQIVVAVSTHTMPNYKSIADLKGKKIGVSAPGSSTNMVFDLLLSRAGMQASDVSFIGVGTGAGAVAALRSGQIDAMSNVDPIMTMLEQKGDIRVIADTRTLKGAEEIFGGPMPAACLYASEKFVKEYPNTTQALTNAMVHGLKWLQTAGPSDIIKTVPESYLLGDRALYLSAFNKVREAISPDGLMPEGGPATSVRALSSFNPAVKTAKIDIARLYTNDFAKRAKAKFQA